MANKRFKVGEKIEGRTTNGTVVVGTIAKVNKTTYKLDSGVLIKFENASTVNEEYWELIVENRMKVALIKALQTADYSKFTYKNVKNSFIALFGANHYELVLNSIKKQLGI